MGGGKKVLFVALIFLFAFFFLSGAKPAYTITPLFKLKWKRYVGKMNRAITCQPLIFGSYVLHATNGNKEGKKDSYDKLYVFDKNGNLLWSFEGKTDMNGVVASPQFIVVTDETGYVYALTWEGKLLWKFKANKKIKDISLGDLNKDGTLDVVMGSDDHYIYTLSGRDGSLLWKFKTGNYVVSSPALGDLDGDGILDVVVGSGDSYIYALSGRDGSLLWKFKTGNWVVSSPALGDLDGDGILDVVVGSGDSYIYALSGRDGSLLWKFKTGNWVGSSPALGDLDGDSILDVVVGSSDYYIYALSGRDGSLLWKFKTGYCVVSLPAIGDLDGDGILDVVMGSDDHYIYTLSGRDGSLLWKFKTGYWVTSSPALGDLDENGYIDMALPSWDGYLYVFEAVKKGGKVVWSRWHGDSAGTGLYENALSFAKANLSGNAFAWEPHKNLVLAAKPPYLEILSVKLFDEDRDRLFEVGEKGSLIVKIANHGKGSAYNLKLKAVSPIFEKSLFISKLKPGEEITKKIDFIVPARIKTGKVYAKVFLDAEKYSPEPVKIAFTTKAPLPPKFKLAYKIDDDRIGESIGNGNGIIEPRETIELVVRVKNVGRGDARGVKLILSSPDVDVIKGTAKLGNLPPGASATDKLIFFVPANISKDKIRFALKIEEALSMFNTKTQLALNVRKPGEKVYNYAVNYGGSGFTSSGLSGGGAFTLSVEIESESSSKASCVKPNPNYYFFGVVVYDYATIPDLNYVKNDKELIKALTTCYMGVPEENVKILENPSYALLKRELRYFAKRIRRKDATFYFYYSGHGILDSQGKFYILPFDASIEDEEVLRDSGIDIDSLKRLLARAKGRKIAFIDACRIEPRWKPAVLVYKPKLSDIAIIFSTKEGQISNADREGRYSAFTRALYEMAKAGIVNVDMDDDGYVEIKEIEKPLTKWIRRISADERQSPDFWGPENFPVFPVE